MTLARIMLGGTGILSLGGCMMMGGWGHAAGPTGTHMDGHMGPQWTVAAPQRAESTGDGLTMTLSIPTAAAGTTITIGAQLRSGAGDPEPTDAEVLLRIEGPDGGTHNVRMQRVPSSGAPTHQAQYLFAAPGRYAVTAEARSGAAPDVRRVSVTTVAEVASPPAFWRGWSVPAAIIGSLAMVAMMAFMMGSGR